MYPNKFAASPNDNPACPKWGPALLVLALGGAIAACSPQANRLDENGGGVITIGWQIPWATQGQLVQVLKRTEILSNQGINADFAGFSYGGPLNEAALAREVDVLFTADQPAATLLSKEPENWKIIGRLMYNRVLLYVPPHSSVKKVEDLRGKSVGMPFGSAAQRMALGAQIDASLNPSRDVNNFHLGIYEQADLVRNVDAVKWGEFDALAGFDPIPAIFQDKGLIRVINQGRVVSVIVMSKRLIDRDKSLPSRFLSAFEEAYLYYRNNIQQVNSWFVEESGLNVSDRVLALCSEIEPNLAANAEIRLTFTSADRAILQEAADFLFAERMIRFRVVMSNHILEKPDVDE